MLRPPELTDLPVQDHIGASIGPGPFQGVVQVRRLVGEDRDDLVEVPVSGGAGDFLRLLRRESFDRVRGKGLVEDLDILDAAGKEVFVRIAVHAREAGASDDQLVRL
jgi:hypothetical protein